MVLPAGRPAPVPDRSFAEAKNAELEARVKQLELALQALSAYTLLREYDMC